MDYATLLQTQRAFFDGGDTLDCNFRLTALEKLEMEIRLREQDILDALHSDLGKVGFEGYMTEVGLVLDELRFFKKHLAKWMKTKRVKTPLLHFPAKSSVRHEPYGLTLVMAPWNYPFLLSMDPLIGAVGAGNCVVLKPSAYAPATSAVMRQLVEACFSPGHVSVVEGGRAENQALLDQRFDYIFFTGSVAVGKEVMAKASRNLTPVTLELGGKSPCIVDDTADIKIAARRIAFGKFLNAGQTCVAPDYLFVHKNVKVALVDALQKEIENFFGKDPLQCPELPKIVNEKHYDRLRGLMEGEEVILGGESDREGRIAPTLLDNVAPSSPIMQEEIFGPLLPILTYSSLDAPIAYVRSHEKPLALYLFTTSAENEARVLRECSFGGGCVNDTIVHLATSHMGFGGVGHSGMGSYHGKWSFETFSHQKSILKKANWLDLRVRYHPYGKAKEKTLRAILK